MLGEQRSRSLKHPFVVENRPRGGGNIGRAAVAEAAPYGYTLMLATGSTLTIHEAICPRLAFDPAKGFAPISLVGDIADRGRQRRGAGPQPARTGGAGQVPPGRSDARLARQRHHAAPGT